MKKTLIALISTFLSASALADVQLSIKDGSGGLSTISSDGMVVRIDDKKRPGYVIIDYAQKQLLMVDSGRGKVMVTNLDRKGPGAAGEIKLRLKKLGGGQRIAGYNTKKYKLIADGQNCGTVYASKKLMRNSGVQAMFESMRSMQNMARGMAAKVGSMLSLCQRANMQLADVVETNGAPLKVLDDKGALISEVLSVDTDKQIPSSYYDVPAGMARVDMDKQLNQAMQQTQQMMENMPDMNEMMQQMQSGGQMNEQVKQQMENMQKMLQQMQQQQQQQQ